MQIKANRNKIWNIKWKQKMNMWIRLKKFPLCTSNWALEFLFSLQIQKKTFEFRVVSAQSANEQNGIKMQCKMRDNQIKIEHSIRFSIFRWMLHIAHHTPTFNIAHRPIDDGTCKPSFFYPFATERHYSFISGYLYHCEPWWALFLHLWDFQYLELWFYIAHIRINKPAKHFTQNCDSCSFHHAYFHLTWNFVLSSRFLFCNIHVNASNE